MQYCSIDLNLVDQESGQQYISTANSKSDTALDFEFLSCDPVYGLSNHLLGIWMFNQILKCQSWEIQYFDFWFSDNECITSKLGDIKRNNWTFLYIPCKVLDIFRYLKVFKARILPDFFFGLFNCLSDIFTNQKISTAIIYSSRNLYSI